MSQGALPTNPLADKFHRAAQWLISMPASPQSLHTKEIAPAVEQSFARNNTVYFGETHDDVNMKFLADNPEIFRTAKANDATKFFAEFGIGYAPLYKAYYESKFSDLQFENELLLITQKGAFASGDSPESLAKQMAAMAKVAKSQGVQILPSDFRDLNPNEGACYTSIAFGIPDIQSIDDSVDRQTRLSLEEYKKLYGQETGFDIPATEQQQFDFKNLHVTRLNALSDADYEQFEDDLHKRAKKFSDDHSLGQINIQNQLQFNYYNMLVKTGEKTIFYGGGLHISEIGNTSELLEAGGFGTTASISLNSNGALVDEKANEIQGVPISNARYAKPFDFIVHTESGAVMDDKGQRLAIPETDIANVSASSKLEKAAPSSAPAF